MVNIKNLADNELVELLKGSDHFAYTEIYDRYHYLMLVHAYKKLRDGDLAKDMVQDLFTNLWLKRDQIPTTHNLRGYLYISIRNNILNHYTRQNVVAYYITTMSAKYSTIEPTNTDHLIREKELQSYIDREIEALPAKMRQVFELGKIKNFTYKQIAETLSLSENTVNSQMVNALGRLRIKLAPYIGFFL